MSSWKVYCVVDLMVSGCSVSRTISSNSVRLPGGNPILLKKATKTKAKSDGVLHPWGIE